MPLDGIKTYFRVKPLPRFVLPYSGFCFDGYLEKYSNACIQSIFGCYWTRLLSKDTQFFNKTTIGWAEFKAWAPTPVKVVLTKSFNANGQYAFEAWRLDSRSLRVVIW